MDGVKLFLVNPQGELQAIFEADENRSCIHTFTLETIERDYPAICQYRG